MQQYCRLRGDQFDTDTSQLFKKHLSNTDRQIRRKRSRDAGDTRTVKAVRCAVASRNIWAIARWWIARNFGDGPVSPTGQAAGVNGIVNRRDDKWQLRLTHDRLPYAVSRDRKGGRREEGWDRRQSSPNAWADAWDNASRGMLINYRSPCRGMISPLSFELIARGGNAW